MDERKDFLLELPAFVVHLPCHSDLRLLSNTSVGYNYRSLAAADLRVQR